MEIKLEEADAVESLLSATDDEHQEGESKGLFGPGRWKSVGKPTGQRPAEGLNPGLATLSGPHALFAGGTPAANGGINVWARTQQHR
jgi:hypothetical protein